MFGSECWKKSQIVYIVILILNKGDKMKKVLIICFTLIAVMVLYAVIHSEYNDIINYFEEKIMGVNDVLLPFEDSQEFIFSSGAGGWATVMTVYNGGHFKGEFHDSNMGEMGNEYPRGTVYLCNFKGVFTDIKKIDENTYSMKLGEVDLNKQPNTREIKDKILYIYAQPYGLEEGEEFILYTPDTPLKELSEEFLSWWPGRYEINNKPETLSAYGILNKDTQQGFFSQY